MRAAHITEVDLPNTQEQQTARDLLRELAPLGPDRVVHVRSEDRDQKVDVILPERVFDALLQLLRHTAEGNAVTLVPIHAELTTQQAADLLKVSRPHLIKLLEAGALPYHQTGRHRRVFTSDLFAYRDKRRAESREAFQELADLSQKHDLGY